MIDQPADRVAGLALRNQLRQAAVIASGKPVSIRGSLIKKPQKARVSRKGRQDPAKAHPSVVNRPPS